MKSQTTKFLEFDMADESSHCQTIERNEQISTMYISPIQQETMEPSLVIIPIEKEEPLQLLVVEALWAQDEVVEVPLRRSTRKRMPIISSDYVVYLGKNDYDIDHMMDPITFQETVSSP